MVWTLASFLGLASFGQSLADIDPRLFDEEQRRIATIAKVSPAVVAVFPPGGEGGGSGVLISPDGYALTNYHVAGESPAFKCGLADGRLYDAVVVGLDPVGDLALLKLLGRDDFPFCQLGDSDRVRVGDDAIAIGNPFLLATDFTPTVTMGIISGVHRYQAPAGNGRLEYTDCIQTDAPVNPGNSGGPLFNLAGEVVGINGRISLEKRGRVNVGVAYAISINQVKNFLDHLRGGLFVDHASLGATVETTDDGRVLVDQIIESSDAFRRGLRKGDEIVAFAHRAISSANDFQNVLGTLPKGWTVDLTYRRDQQKTTLRVRLAGSQPSSPEAKPAGKPKVARVPERIPLPKDVAALYEKKDGFANYYFNRLRRDRLLDAMKQSGDFSKNTGVWKLVFDANGKEIVCAIQPDSVLWSADGESFAYKPGAHGNDLPAGSGGLLLALDQWRQLLIAGPRWFSQCDYAGSQPDHDGTARLVIATTRGGSAARWLFDRQTNRLVGMESWAAVDAEPCEIRWADEHPVGDRRLPKRWIVDHAGRNYMTLTLKSAELSP